MSRLPLLILALVAAPARAAEGAGTSLAGLIVLVLIGLAVWFSLPPKRKPRAARPPRADGAGDAR